MSKKLMKALYYIAWAVGIFAVIMLLYGIVVSLN